MTQVATPRSPAIRPSPAPGARSIRLLFRNRLQQARISERRSSMNDMRREIAAAASSSARCDPTGLAPQCRCATTSSRWTAEQRVAETIYMPDAIVVDVPKPTAEQLNTYFEANKSKFQIPEFRAFSYIMLTADDVHAVRSPSPPTRSSRNTRRAPPSSARPEKRDVDQAMTDSEDKAKAIIAAVTAGKSLEDAAKEVTGNADGVIKLGPVTKKDLPPGALADGMFGPAEWHRGRRRSSHRSAGTSSASTRSRPASPCRSKR